MQRQRDRDRDRMSHYWEDRERDSRRSRSRSRSRERRRGWDDTGDYEQQHHHLQPPPPRQHFAGSGLGNSAFELYVGGLRPGQVTEVMLAELFSQILGQCEGFSAAGGPPVTAVRCVEEIRAEVASFGAVAAFALPRRAGDFARAPDAAATCFVKYELVSSAVKAHAALHAREFDGNVVRASFLRPEVLGW